MTELQTLIHRPKAKRPKYFLLKEFLREEILSDGSFVSGGLLPTETFIANEAKVARNTVRQAIAELIKDGLICKVPGRGNYVAAHLINGEEETNKKQSPEDSLTIAPVLTTADSNLTAETIAVIMPETQRSLLPTLISGFEKSATENHLSLSIYTTRYMDLDRQSSVILKILDLNPRGVVMVPTFSSQTLPFQMRVLQRSLPVVFCVRRPQDAQGPLVTWDFEKVGRFAAEKLLELGHRQIAYLAFGRYSATETYERQLRKVLEENGLGLPEHRVFFGSPDIELLDEKRKILKRWTSGHNPVTAVFCNDDRESEILYLLAGELGLRVPEDISLLGTGAPRNSDRGLLKAKLSVVTIDSKQVGQQAIATLDMLCKGNKGRYDNEVSYLEAGFHEGSTLRPL